MGTFDPKADLKRKLCACIDELGDASGFVLVASADDISFTTLTAGCWDERVLDVEPLNLAEARQESAEVWARVHKGEVRKRTLEQEIAEKEARLSDLNAAIATALGKRGNQ